MKPFPPQEALEAIQKGEVVGSGAVHAPHREPGAKGREEGSHDRPGVLKAIQEGRKGGGRGRMGRIMCGILVSGQPLLLG